MFKLKALSVALIGATLMGCNPQEESSAPTAPELVSLEQRAGYLIGLQYGQQLASGDVELDQAAIVAGLNDGLNGNEGLLDEAQIEATLTEFTAYIEQKRSETMAQIEAERLAQATENEAAGIEFLATNGAREGVITTESGLQYEVITEGDGPQATADSVVTVNYTGTLLDGSVFDSTDLHGQPATFALSQVIPGWTEGVGLMNVGSTHKLYIPYHLAYGEDGTNGIPPKSTLVFEVELLGIE